MDTAKDAEKRVKKEPTFEPSNQPYRPMKPTDLPILLLLLLTRPIAAPGQPTATPCDTLLLTDGRMLLVDLRKETEEGAYYTLCRDTATNPQQYLVRADQISEVRYRKKLPRPPKSRRPPQEKKPTASSPVEERTTALQPPPEPLPPPVTYLPPPLRGKSSRHAPKPVQASPPRTARPQVKIPRYIIWAGVEGRSFFPAGIHGRFGLEAQPWKRFFRVAAFYEPLSLTRLYAGRGGKVTRESSLNGEWGLQTKFFFVSRKTHRVSTFYAGTDCRGARQKFTLQRPVILNGQHLIEVGHYPLGWFRTGIGFGLQAYLRHTAIDLGMTINLFQNGQYFKPSQASLGTTAMHLSAGFAF